MSMTEWAENEVKLACKKENPDWDGESFDYGCSCYQSALKAYKSLCDDGHSGFSFSLTKNILIRLMNSLPLTPIEDTEDVWKMSYKDEDGTVIYQCVRKSSLFKDVKKDGSVSYHDNNRCYCQEIDDPKDTYINGVAEKFVDELFPITMPYYPNTLERYKVVVRTFSAEGYEKDNEDYNTRGYLFVDAPDGKHFDIGRFYADVNGRMVEITREEYLKRFEHRKINSDKQTIS